MLCSGFYISRSMLKFLRSRCLLTIHVNNIFIFGNVLSTGTCQLPSVTSDLKEIFRETQLRDLVGHVPIFTVRPYLYFDSRTACRRRLGCVFELFLALFSLLEHLNTRVTPFRQRKWSESPPLSDTRANLFIGQTSAIRTPIECMKTFCEYLPCYPKLFIWRVKR